MAARIWKFGSVCQPTTSPGFWVSRTTAPVVRSTRYWSKTCRSRRLSPTRISLGNFLSIMIPSARMPWKGVRSRVIWVARSTE